MTPFLEDGQSGGLEHVSKTIAEINARFQIAAAEQEAREAEIPTCPACGSRIEGGGCNYCASRKQEFIHRRREADICRLGGLKAYQFFTLEKYDNLAAVELCAGYPEQNLFIWGATGTGKTHLATTLVRECLEAWIIKPQHIYRECRGLKSGDDEQAAINYYVNLPYLVIDDLGQDKRTDWNFSTLYEIIDGRDMACRGGLIITSNLPLDGLATHLGGDQITSRLAGMCKIIELTGTDRRLK